MPSAQQQRERLVGLLKELFQLDQPDLDFGFWRIMHAKSKQVTEFLEKDLLAVIEDAFGKQNATRRGELEQAYQQAMQSAKDFGAPEPEKAPAVVKASAAMDAYAQSASAEGEVYDHLYRFFERYYDNGDFLSRRYYSAESESKAAAYAVPYDGREVYLHWANADQYYIKTSEYFTNFTFDPTKTSEVQDHADLFAGQSLSEPLKVHFRVVEATEGEHGNVKAAAEQKRFFILHEEDTITIENGELTVRFEYRPDPEKGERKQEGPWQQQRNEQAVQTVLKALDAHPDGKAQLFAAVLRAPAPTEKQKDRPLLAKYLAQYTARNTMDYFIHKNLGGFLRRELDFYIKNEVMRLDDLDQADAPRAESYLDKVRVLRQIARQIIDFLAQLEDFQKKLWLKKKFVVETHWCITLDRIPEELYPEIAANDAQREEWVRLFAIDEIEADLGRQGYSTPLTVRFLKESPSLVLDTQFFGKAFCEQLVASVENCDGRCDGVAIEGDSFQGLVLLTARYRRSVKCTYADPPYNTGNDEFVYKDAYRHSTWLSMMADRGLALKNLTEPGHLLWCSVDDHECVHCKMLLDFVLGEERFVSDISVVNNLKGRQDRAHIATAHEHLLLYAGEQGSSYGFPLSAERLAEFDARDENGLACELRDLRRRGGGDRREDRPNMYFPIYWNAAENRAMLERSSEDDIEVYPKRSDGSDGRWRWGKDRVRENLSILAARATPRGDKWNVYYRVYLQNGDGSQRRSKPKSIWIDPKYSTDVAGKTLKSMIPDTRFTAPKPVDLLIDVLHHSVEDGDLVFDFTAGTGTTGHAVIDLGRTAGVDCRYLLVEMARHFYTDLIPRLQKGVYSKDWKDGKPVSRETGVSHMFKYIRLESYEDCLNNLVLSDDAERERALAANPGLRRGYMLKYMLEVETRGSASLLNIDWFADPTAYTLRVKKPGTDEYVDKAVDLIETFNYLLGLRVEHMAAPETLTAAFQRTKDPELPEDQDTRLTIKGKLRRADNGAWWFRRIEGWVPRNPDTPNDGQREKVLIIWRKLTGDLEKDNAVLDAYCLNLGINTLDFEYDTIYVNGSNNLPNLKRDEDKWKVGLIEEDFHRLMWDVEDV